MSQFNAARDLEDQFFTKLKEISSRQGMKPEDLLLVMLSESGANPGIFNLATPDKSNAAVGIFQFMPATLKGLGWDKGTIAFSKLPASAQLDYADKMITSLRQMNGGKSFPSAASYYHANFFPKTLKRGSSPDTIVASGSAKDRLEQMAYQNNKGFDKDNKGYITVEDLDKSLSRTRSSSTYKQLLDRLHSASSGSSSYIEDKEVKSKPISDKENISDLSTAIKDITSELDSFALSRDNKLLKRLSYYLALGK